MAGHIGERLLRHAEQAQLRFLADHRRQGFDVHGHGEPALATPPFAFRAQRLDQAEFLEHRRVELVGQRVDVLAQAHELGADRAHHIGLRTFRRGEFGAAHVDGQHGQPLRHVVVQLAREQGALVLVGPYQAPAQIAQRLLGLLGLGDVAQDTKRPQRAPGGVTPGDAGHVMNPPFATGRMREAIFHGKAFQPPRVELPTQVQHTFAVVRMNLLHPEFERLEALRPVSGNATQVAQAVVDVGDAVAEVHLVERQAGEIGTRRQARLALQQPVLLALADERVGEDLRHQLQPLHQRVRPVTLRVHRAETQDSNGLIHPQRKGKGQIRLDADEVGAFAVDGGLCRKQIQRGQGHGAPGQQFLRVPGKLCLVQRSGGWYALAGVDMCGRGDTRSEIRPLPQHRQVDAERHRHATQRVFDLAVYLARPQVDELGGDVRDHPLEVQALLKAVGGGPRFIDRGHGAESWGCILRR